MNAKEIETFYSTELPENIYALRFDLRNKDILLSGELVENAVKGNWDEVTRLLAQGADPRICRWRKE